MINPRLVRYAAVLVILLIAGYLLAIAGLTLCAPPPLEGDAVWTWQMRLREALGVTLGDRPRCFLRVRSGELALALGAWSLLAALAAVALASAWEVLGRPLRRQWRRTRGGHAILAGEPDEIESLAAGLGSAGAAFVVRNAALATAVGQRRPFADVSVLADRRQARSWLATLGGARAGLIAATTANDLTNGEIAEAALAEGGDGEVLVRFENSAVRALKSDALRRLAEARQRGLTVVSLGQIHARQALAAAMPGRYLTSCAQVHVAVCGSGPMMQDATLLIARQGYGLEAAPPIVSIMRTGHTDFAAGVLDRLLKVEAIELRVVVADGESAVDIDRNFTGIALSPIPLTAVHCCEDHEGAALALALRLERVCADLEIPVSPIVVHGDGPDAPGDTGMIRVARRPTLAEARTHAGRIDRRARAFHEAYLAGQRAIRGAAFGDLPGEAEWQVLKEQLRDDNRYSADHIEYKLARAGFIAEAGEAGPGLDPADVEMLAPLEHARWMASKSLGGTRYGSPRDDRLLLHPDMKPYSGLAEDARRKDREQIAVLAAQLTAGGERLLRLRPVGILSANGIERAVQVLERFAAPGERPLAVVALDSPGGIASAEACLNAGIAVEAHITGAPEHVFDDDPLRRRAAAILRQAWRIGVAARDREAAAAIAGKYPVLVDADGGLHEAVLA